MENITIRINGTEVSAPKNPTTFEIAGIAHIETPTLCFFKEINKVGACHTCMVEVEGAGSLVAFCAYPINSEMEVLTNTPKVLDPRKKTLQLLLSNHEKKCFSYMRSGNCELQILAKELGVEDEAYYNGTVTQSCPDDSAAHMICDNSKCTLCRRRVAVYEEVQDIGVIGTNNRGFDINIGSASKMGPGETSCASRGQYIAVCPIGALHEKDYIDDIPAVITDSDKHMIAQTAPVAHAGPGEEFGYPIGINVEDEMIAALRRISPDEVFDTDFSVDLTITEEAHEFIERVQHGGVFPMITSRPPGWIKYCERYFLDMTENLFSCKSPQQISSAIAKFCYAEKQGLKPKDIVSASIMPYTARKSEIGRNNQTAGDVPDISYFLITRELAGTIKRLDIRLNELPGKEFDAPLGPDTGAVVIFNATGGVMEAVLRTTVETLTGEELAVLDFTGVCGMKGIKEATHPIAKTDVKVAVASGSSNAKKLLDKVKSGEADHHFIEVMGCPGRCVSGGGQSQQPGPIYSTVDVRALRAQVLYGFDKNDPIRRSHEDPAIKGLHDTYFNRPDSEVAYRLLHTIYVKGRINEI